MRPPRSEIEPLRRGVSIAMRGERPSSSCRETSCCGGAAGTAFGVCHSSGAAFRRPSPGANDVAKKYCQVIRMITENAMARKTLL
jgi:hypothetical protein